MEILKESLRLCREWHEAGRADFEASYKVLDLDYDSAPYQKHVIPATTYLHLLEGSSGAFMVEISTGNLFCIKGYGKVDRRKFVGNVAELAGEALFRSRYMRPNLKQPVKADEIRKAGSA